MFTASLMSQMNTRSKVMEQCFLLTTFQQHQHKLNFNISQMNTRSKVMEQCSLMLKFDLC